MADISSSVHIDNEGKDILIFVEGPTQGLDDTILTAEAKYPITYTQSGKIFALYWAYTIIEATVSNFLVLQKYVNPKQKDRK